MLVKGTLCAINAKVFDKRKRIYAQKFPQKAFSFVRMEHLGQEKRRRKYKRIENESFEERITLS